MALVEIWRRYEAAPLEALQLIVGLADTPVAPSDGDDGDAGGEGIETITMVVKLDAELHVLVPDALVALTRQKYCVPPESPVTKYDVAVIPP